jgi:hypothetical protein
MNSSGMSELDLEREWKRRYRSSTRIAKAVHGLTWFKPQGKGRSKGDARRRWKGDARVRELEEREREHRINDAMGVDGEEISELEESGEDDESDSGEINLKAL